MEDLKKQLENEPASYCELRRNDYHSSVSGILANIRVSHDFSILCRFLLSSDM